MNRNPATDPDHDPKNDSAWDLLLKARKVEVSPFFARNVVREIRLMDEARTSGWRSILSLPRLLVGTAAAAIVVAVIVVSDRSAPNATEVASTAQITEPAEVTEAAATPRSLTDAFDMGDYEDEIEMIDYLDGLLAVQDITTLDDEALSELLF